MNILVCIFVLSLIMIVLLLSFDKSENYENNKDNPPCPGPPCDPNPNEGCEPACCGNNAGSGQYCGLFNNSSATFGCAYPECGNPCTDCLTNQNREIAGHLNCIDTIPKSENIRLVTNSDGTISNFCNAYKIVQKYCGNDSVTMQAWDGALLANMGGSNKCGISPLPIKCGLAPSDSVCSVPTSVGACPTECNACYQDPPSGGAGGVCTAST